MSAAPETAQEFLIPDDLTERDQWVLWRYEDRSGRATKVPYQAGRRRASSTEPSTWASFESVTNEWRRAPNYVAELRESGVSWREIAGRTGASVRDGMAHPGHR